ncbi:protoglobin domain-containing protein [Acidocella sp.]|uniref:protoglobin domain-containing protein n=1 Tax=Acidocella sp. TaxID=50710 RepID=UPI0026259262|nr:protoglobin domain-containing protein [Acidocella sp.]
MPKVKREEEFKTALHALIDANRQILAAALVGARGECLAQIGSAHMDGAEISAYLPALLVPGPGALSQLRINPQGFMLANLPSGHVLVRQVGQMAALCVLSRGGGKLPLPLPDTTALALRLEAFQSAAAEPAASIPAPEPVSVPLILPDFPSRPVAAPAADEAMPPAATPPPAGPVFSAEDAASIRALAPLIAPHLPAITTRFYAVIKAQPQMARFIGDAETRLRQAHEAWLESLFAGEYGAAFRARQREIGTAHNHAGVPPLLAAASMVFLSKSFTNAIRDDLEDPHEAATALAALNRLLLFCQSLMDDRYTHLIARLEGAAG